MKVLQLSKHYPPYCGGIESVTFDLTEGLNRNGISCDVLCANDCNVHVHEIDRNYHVERARSFGKLFSTSFAPALLTAFERCHKDYDIIHVHFPNPLAAIALYLSRPASKVVVHWHSDVVKQSAALMLYQPLQNWVLKRAARIVGTSLKYIDGSVPLAGHKNKTTAIPIGIPETRLQSNCSLVKEIKDRFHRKKIVLAIGRLVYYKGFEYLIDAAQNISRDAIIVIGGEGGLKKSLQKRIIELGLQDRVILIGRIPQDQLGSYYQACDIFCLPSIERSEAFGVVQLEAMVFGKPIIATDVRGSGVSWVNSDGYSGFNVPVGNVEALANKINLLLKDDGLSEFLGLNSRKRYEELFTDKTMIRSFIDLYSEITNSPVIETAVCIPKQMPHQV